MMKPPSHLPDDVAEVWADLARQCDPQKIRANAVQFEAYCGQVARLRDAQHRLRTEGMLVPDSKENPVQHPALAIERAAQDEIRKWGGRFL